MITATFITLLLITVVVLLQMKRVRCAKFISMFTLLIFLIFCTPFLPAYLAAQLQMPSPNSIPFKEANIFVLLGGGQVITATGEHVPNQLAYSRIVKTVIIYNQCLAAKKSCRIIVSGGDAHQYGMSEAALYQSLLVLLGVNQNNILLEELSANTKENAIHTNAILKTLHYDQLFLITSGTHLLRAAAHFKQLGLNPILIPSDYSTAMTLPYPVSYNMTLIDLTLHEWIGLLKLWY